MSGPFVRGVTNERLTTLIGGSLRFLQEPSAMSPIQHVSRVGRKGLPGYQRAKPPHQGLPVILIGQSSGWRTGVTRASVTME
jgi:hypothetical protein